MLLRSSAFSEIPRTSKLARYDQTDYDDVVNARLRLTGFVILANPSNAFLLFGKVDDDCA